MQSLTAALKQKVRSSCFGKDASRCSTTDIMACSGCRFNANRVPSSEVAMCCRTVMALERLTAFYKELVDELELALFSALQGR